MTEKIADYFTRAAAAAAPTSCSTSTPAARTLDFLPFAAAHVLPDKAQEARCFAAVAAFAAPYSMQMLEIDAVGMFDTAAEDDGQDLRHHRARRRRHRPRRDRAPSPSAASRNVLAPRRHPRRRARARADPLARHAVRRLLRLRRG